MFPRVLRVFERAHDLYVLLRPSRISAACGSSSYLHMLFTARAMQSKAWPFHDTNNKNSNTGRLQHIMRRISLL